MMKMLNLMEANKANQRGAINYWELNFLMNVSSKLDRLTDKQLAMLNKIRTEALFKGFDI